MASLRVRQPPGCRLRNPPSSTCTDEETGNTAAEEEDDPLGQNNKPAPPDPVSGSILRAREATRQAPDPASKSQLEAAHRATAATSAAANIGMISENSALTVHFTDDIDERSTLDRSRSDPSGLSSPPTPAAELQSVRSYSSPVGSLRPPPSISSSYSSPVEGQRYNPSDEEAAATASGGYGVVVIPPSMTSLPEVSAITHTGGLSLGNSISDQSRSAQDSSSGPPVPPVTSAAGRSQRDDYDAQPTIEVTNLTDITDPADRPLPAYRKQKQKSATEDSRASLRSISNRSFPFSFTTPEGPVTSNRCLCYCLVGALLIAGGIIAAGVICGSGNC